MFHDVNSLYCFFVALVLPNKPSIVTCKPPLPRGRRSNRKVAPCVIKADIHEVESSISETIESPPLPRESDSAMSSYSSSSLDEPLPRWTAYSPKKGVAWAPKRTHSWTEPAEPIHRTFSFNNLSGSLTSVVDSLVSVLTPKLGNIVSNYR